MKHTKELIWLTSNKQKTVGYYCSIRASSIYHCSSINDRREKTAVEEEIQPNTSNVKTNQLWSDRTDLNSRWNRMGGILFSSSARRKEKSMRWRWPSLFPCRRRINRITIVVFSGSIEGKICYWRTTRYELDREETRERVTNTKRQDDSFLREDEEEKIMKEKKKELRWSLLLTDVRSVYVLSDYQGTTATAQIYPISNEQR